MSGSDFSAGQEDVDAVVMMPQTSGVMEAAEGSDYLAMFLQRLERLGEFVLFAVLGDLIVQRMDAVGQVDKGAASRRGDFLGSPKRGHAFEHGEGNAGAHCPKGVSAVH